MSTSTARRSWRARLRRPPRPRVSRVGLAVEGQTLLLAQHRATGGHNAWSVARLDLPPAGEDQPRAMSAWAHQVRSTQSLPHGTAVCAVASGALEIFPLTLRPKEGESLAGLVIAGAREQLSQPLAEAVLDFVVMPEEVRRPGEDQLGVLVFSYPRDRVARLLAQQEALGWTTTRLLTPACTLAPRVRGCGPRRRHLLVTTGEEASSIAVVQNGNVLLERMLPWGLQRLSEILQAALDLSPSQCRALLAPHAPGSEAPAPPFRVNADDPVVVTLSEILQPTCEEITREAAGCLGYCDSVFQHAEAAAIVLSGAMAELLPLRRSLEQHVQLPIQLPAEALELAQLNEQPDGVGYAVAASCALWTEEPAP